MVEILHYEKANRNKTIGYVDIKVPILKPTIMIFRRIAHIQSGDKKWFSLPSFCRDKESGDKNYFKFCQFETEIYNDQLLDNISENLKKYLALHGIEEAHKMEFDHFPEHPDCPF